MKLTAFVDDLVYEPTQTDSPGLDLTVDSISRITDPGRVDFGGGELTAAETDPVQPKSAIPRTTTAGGISPRAST